MILAIDASTTIGTIALLAEGRVVAESVVAMRGADEERLMPAIVALLTERGADASDLTGVAVGAGPGSFTSLRIAAAIAKGLAVTRRVPLYTTSSPLLVVAGAASSLAAGRYVACLDAMRGDVFAQTIDVRSPTELHVLGAPVLASVRDTEVHADSLGARLVGPVADPPIMPHARGFAVLIGTDALREVDAESWEPDYGRKAEAQVRWEKAHGRSLDSQ